jgi:hypothetical protein
LRPHGFRKALVVVACWPGGYTKRVTGPDFKTPDEAWFWIRFDFENWLRKNGGSPMKKRPRDPAQLAKLIVDIATGEVEDRKPTPSAAAELGRKGGEARAKSVSPKRRKEIAKRAAAQRWVKKIVPVE